MVARTGCARKTLPFGVVGPGSVEPCVVDRLLAAPLLIALRALVEWWAAARVRGVVIGGVAASLLGRPRLTGDVDALVIVDEDGWSQFLAAGRPFGIRPRRADALAFARRSRVLLLRHEPSGIDLDVSLGALPFEYEVIARSRRRRVSGVAVPLATAEDLIVMKAIAGRPRDIADIEGLRDTHPRLDRKRIVGLVREFAAVLETPSMATELDRILGPTPRPIRNQAGSRGRRKKAPS